MHRDERQKLVLENLPLVGYFVAGLCAKASHLSREDLAAAAALALVTSSQSFNPEAGVPFGVFARRRILGAMADDMRASDWPTRNIRTPIKTTLKFSETLAGYLGWKPTADELAATLGVTQAEVNIALTDGSGSVIPLDEGSATFFPDGLAPEESVRAAEDRLVLHAAVRALPQKMRYLIERLYFEDRSVKSLADELQTTPSAVSQQRAEAIRLLHDRLNTYERPSASHPAKAHSGSSAPRLTMHLTKVSSLTAGRITRTALPYQAVV